jgi:hypothetical protein
MMTPLERRLHRATVKAIREAKANGTYKPPTPYPYTYTEIGHSELYAYKTRNHFRQTSIT